MIKVTDGDTIKVRGSDDKILNVRFAGIDAPEKKQPFGKDAASYLSSLLLNKDIRVQVDTVDRYGRKIAWIYHHDDEHLLSPINFHLVYKGHAWHYKQYYKNTYLTAEEKAAKENKRGLWALENPVAPWDWRKGKRDATN